ncbi:glycosyltransferase family 9 protein [methane-oxidizing endosymbiont of Gigantopelta aegis]|uniref:glycosyltransferase family 9 protein n=1 Tax=methane-oxidizing endosymbiont of Gigantopelta aegis TaxID=2794938 RepID=UPI003159E06B
MGHQVEKYNQLISVCTGRTVVPGRLKIYRKAVKNKPQRPLLGINPGASYGSAKRWYPEEFAKVAAALACQYDIIIFGGPNEIDIAADIEEGLKKSGVENYQNLAGKTSVDELIDAITGLDLMITGDSGPMHLAAAFQVPTVTVFGPTQDKETAQWQNAKSIIIKKIYPANPA